jgi:hypothetical protein
VIAEADTGPVGGISEHQVTTIANLLIDQQVLSGDASESELMVGAGIKVGIGLMAMEVKKVLSARKRQQGPLQKVEAVSEGANANTAELSA